MKNGGQVYRNHFILKTRLAKNNDKKIRNIEFILFKYIFFKVETEFLIFLNSY